MPSCAFTNIFFARGAARLAMIWVVSLGLAFMAASNHLATAQEEEDLGDGMAEIQVFLERGRELFEELEFGEAIQNLTRAIEIYESGKLSMGYEDETTDLVAEALDLRARAQFNLGEKERASEDFARLLKLKIDFHLDRERVSPKVVDLFEKVREQTVGSLTIVTNPPGAEAWLNEEVLSRTPVLSWSAVVGEYALRLSLPGFEDHLEGVAIEPGKEVKLEFQLKPNRRDLKFITQPSGVRVLVDGELKGTTFGDLPPDLHATASEAGLNPLEASAPLLVKNVEPGKHEVLFEKECYQASPHLIQVSLDVDENLPQVFRPVVLNQQHGELSVTSHPSGARVLVDGKERGTTPVRLGTVCAGDREIRLEKRDGGTWFDAVRIRADEENTLDVSLRPTLLYLGTFRMDEWGRLEWSEEDGILREELSKMQSVNRVKPGDDFEAFREALARDMKAPEYADQLRQGAGLPPRRVLEAMTSFGADLLLASIWLQDQPGRGAPRMFLYSSGQPDPDVERLNLADETAVKSFRARFDSVPVLTRPWIGASFADTLLTEGPIVIRVVEAEKAPATVAGLIPGDEVLAVNGRKVSNAHELSSTLTKLETGQRARLDVRRQETNLNIELQVGQTAVLLPMNSPARLYNKALADYRQLSRGADDPLERALALLNQGIAYMHFGSYDKALTEALNLAGLPDGGGVSRGTVQYYQGLCYLEKDLVPEARTAFQQALNSDQATLESNDGPLVSVRARKLLQ